MIININENIKELLFNGEDYMAREELSSKLDNTIQKSTMGELSLAGFIEELESALKQAKEYRDIFNNN